MIGSEDFVLGFQLAGVRQAVRSNPETYSQDVERLLTSGLGILIVDAKDVATLNPYQRKRLTDSNEPVVIQMGGESGGDLREKVKRAIGIDLYKD
ncbi:MAG TPA: V-type ATP synthase subunit F [Candidatus Thermoplasmatota archaeon]|nr:V-type ATP synthase subunit F [Candidatus Thermoplasmatota archaeon]